MEAPNDPLVSVINENLKRIGSTPIGQPLFRLVWSDSQRELRKGTFEDYYGSIYLHTVTEVRDVEKYPYLAHCWVIEKWIPPARIFEGELVKWNEGSYEPVYVFQHPKTREPLPLNLRVVEIVINALLAPRTTPLTKRADCETAEEEKWRRDRRLIEEMLDLSPIQNALHMREAVGYGK